MTWPRRSVRRILAIDPWGRGFGYAVFEGPDALVDWGARSTRSTRNVKCLPHVARLIDEFAPDVLVFEDVRGAGSRRGAKARDVIREVARLAARRRIATSSIARRSLYRAFPEVEVMTKHAAAKAIARRFPYLIPLVPPFRKPWMSEDYRMAIFDAVAFGAAYYALRTPRRQAAAADSVDRTIAA